MGVRTASTMTTSRPVDDMRTSLRAVDWRVSQHPAPAPRAARHRRQRHDRARPGRPRGPPRAGDPVRALGAQRGRPRATGSTPTRSRSRATARRSRRPRFVVEAIVEEHAAKTALFGELARDPRPRRDPRHHDLVAVGGPARRRERAPRALRRPARLQPRDEDGARRARVPGRRHARTRATRTRALCEALGKTAVEVADTPGFVVNRLLFPYLFDAVELLERTGMDAAGGRHVHEARRRPPDRARWRCSTSSASTSPWRSARRSARKIPAARRRARSPRARSAARPAAASIRTKPEAIF